ncbi:unnamed protein product [Bemisia tabaci]|uniref:F-box domain-containing protein n=1 Tax=Bemisia tabaci TaxID=7038 RepID=A0A9P0A167_BEMTA|nr:unnamed protein product [Bemisia tabaci]
MEESSDYDSDKLRKASICSDQIEDSGYGSNLSELSESFPHQTPVNCTPQFHPSSASFVSFSDVKDRQEFLHPSNSCRSDFLTPFQNGPCSSISFANLGKRVNISDEFQTFPSSAKRIRSDSEGEANSTSKASFKDTTGLAEPKFHVSTPYCEFIDKLRYSPSPSSNHSLFGVSHVDFLYFLGVKNIHNPVLQRIYSYLSDHDLYNVARVSKTWHTLVKSNNSTRERIENFLRKPLKENIVPGASLAKVCDDDELPASLIGRVKLMEIQNRTANHQNVQNQGKTASTDKSPPVSPSKVRFHLFQKEAQKLDPGEQLVQCPGVLYRHGKIKPKI